MVLRSRDEFRNLFALVIWCSIAVCWVLHGAGVIKLPEQVVGALISILTLITQFYFRKRGAGSK